MRNLRKQAGRVAALATLLAAPAVWAAPGPVQATEALITAFKSVTPLPDNAAALTAAQRKGNAEAFAKLDAFFDFERLTSEPIAPLTGKLTAEQRTRFTADFKELIRLVAYPKSGAFFEAAEYELKPSPAKAGSTSDVAMSAYLPKEDLHTNVTFHWARTPSGWKIIDVSFDGASLLKDYRAQFGRIVDKEGAGGLIDRVAKRLVAERQANAGVL